MTTKDKDKETKQTIIKAMQVIIARSGNQNAQSHAMQTIRAIDAGSSVIQHRANNSISLALYSDHNFNDDDLSLLASIVGSAKPDKTIAKSVRFSQSEIAAMETAKDEGENLSQFIRRKALN